MKRLIYKLLFFSVVVGFLCGCGEMNKPQRIVSVTIQPQRYFAEKIAGGLYEINCMVPVGSSPESYDPSPNHLVYAGKSEAYFKMGYLGFELAWMNKLIHNNPEMKLFDNSKGVEMLNCTHFCPGESIHIHGNENYDPHIWSSPKAVAIIAENMYNAFSEIDPKNKRTYRKNYDSLVVEINRVDSILTEILPSEISFAIYHPSLSYLARDYNLTQLSIEMDGKEPSALSMKKLIDEARKQDVKVVFVQKEFDQKNVEIFAQEVGCKVVEINPLNYNWNDELLRIGNILHNEYTNQN